MTQLDHTRAFASVIGQLIGLQKHEKNWEFIKKALGSDKAADEFAAQLFKLADMIQDNHIDPHFNS